MGSREALAQGRDDVLEPEGLHHPLEDTLIAFCLRAAAFHVCIGLETETEFCILLIADAHIDILHERTHDALCLLAAPQLLAEVEVTAHHHPMLLGCHAGQAQTLSTGVTDGRSNAAPVEPVRSLEDGVKVKVLWLALSDGAVRTVVDNLGRTHRGTRLQVVYAQSVTAACHEIRVHAIAAQGVEARLPNLVLGHFAHEVGLMSVIGAAYCHVGFTTTIIDVESVGLNDAALTGSREAEHNLAHGYNLCHYSVLFSRFMSSCRDKHPFSQQNYK